jgi:dihydroorotase-like cyclic amidohydrolase
MSDCGRRRTRPVANGADYTPYEGLEITGWPLTTILRGRFVSGWDELRAALTEACASLEAQAGPT